MKVKHTVKKLYDTGGKVWKGFFAWVRCNYYKYISPPVEKDYSSYLVLLFSISAVFLYVSTVMFHSSYVSYFGISEDVVSSSIKNNIFLFINMFPKIIKEYWEELLRLLTSPAQS